MKNAQKQKHSPKIKLKPVFRVLIFSSIAFITAFSIVFIYANLAMPKKARAGLGLLGAKTVTTTNAILNEFTNLTGNASSGATSLTVANAYLNTNSRFSGNLAAGELVLIIQMQGATMTTSSGTSSAWGTITAYNSAGKYEFNEVASVPNSTTINLTTGLKNSYTGSGAVQVVRVPRYTTFVINAGASVTTDAWNGSTGGIVAIEANSTTSVLGIIDVSGKGFRGGTVQNTSTCCSDGADSSTYATTTSSSGAEKGEGIGGSTTTYDGLKGRYGRGAPANGGGGGNAHNAAGGGGSNGNNGVAWNGYGNPDTTTVSTWKTAWDLDGATSSFHKNVSSGGGRGGYTYSAKNKSATANPPTTGSWSGDDRANVGGLGGRPLTNNGSLAFMGGGGGAGDSNDGLGTSGANGGGIVFLLGGSTVSGGGTISANGSDAGTSTTPINQANPNGDGSGGGGAGGSVVIYTPGPAVSNLTISANGGVGGSQDIYVTNGGDSLEAEGAGGGGGGGYIITTNANSLTETVTAGNNGTTNSLSLTEFIPNGGTRGALGAIALNTPNPYTPPEHLPVELIDFSAQPKKDIVELNWSTASEVNNNYFTIERSADGYAFMPLIDVKGNGSSDHVNNYICNDGAPIKGNNYYRLKQTDYDGNSQTFNTILVRMNQIISGNVLISAGLIPFKDHLTLNYSLGNSATVKFSIYNNTGELVEVVQTTGGSGINAFKFSDISSMPAGIYIVVMTAGESTAGTLKVLK